MSDARTRRLAERISKIVAELLERRIKDPRLGFVTVTEVRHEKKQVVLKTECRVGGKLVIDGEATVMVTQT